MVRGLSRWLLSSFAPLARRAAVLAPFALAPFTFIGCGEREAPAIEPSEAPAQTSAPSVDADVAPQLEAPRSGASGARARPSLEGPRAEIAAGSFEVGSVPGTAFRRPAREADRVQVELPAFSIDRRPYPNDPRLAPLLVGSRAEAVALCAEREARLCTELEWERACGGPEASVFPTGDTLDLDACMREPARCASGFGVVAMGVERPEWTASNVTTRLGERAVLRGARDDRPADFHRCAARTEQLEAPDPSGARPQPAAFRCCYGPAPEVAYPEPEPGRTFRDVTMSLDEVRDALRSVDRLAPWADAFTPYDETDGDRALARGRATREALVGWELTNGPFLWSPTAGDEALVLSGRSGEDTLIAVLYPRPSGGYWHAASFVFEGERAPIAITRTPPSRGELLWTACQGCGGESGAIRLGEDSILRIVTR